ncbi:non-specific lipid transfer protein GPI-anchored 2-like [Ananas comosus]|uniref:Non-specific lipid transfer protein GPI-anchored 2-like n=1 Tax=Ananas comosus TaxID=4615 RepID=A0A6P5HAP8_ANACO|nr:non-specific lipid transfer protein GPI-anchored 2-like [Ananas comosus]
MSRHSIVRVLAAALAAQVEAPAGSGPAPAPGPDCMTAVLNASDCLGYVTPGSKDRRPDKACCPELAALVDSQPVCLCQLLNGTAAAAYGISIDTARALALPKACRVDTPPLSLCAAIGFPINFGPSPAPSPGTSPLLPGSTPTAPPSGADRGIRGLRAVDLAFLAALSYAIAASGIF